MSSKMGTEQKSDSLFRLTGLSTDDLADTLASNPRAYMALKGAVAEKHLCIYLENLLKNKKIDSFRCGRGDFEKDFYITLPKRSKEVIIECKNVQVIQTTSVTTKREYLEFLRRNRYVDTDELKKLLPHGNTTFENASSTELAAIFRGLPLELRESGLPRYAFSRKICKIDEAGTLSSRTCVDYLSHFDGFPVTIDFQRTRNSMDSEAGDGKANRFYGVGEIDVVAACLFSRTLEWQFIFCPAHKLVKHTTHTDRYSNGVKVKPTDWKVDLLDVIT
jgi:hypothetical protein